MRGLGRLSAVWESRGQGQLQQRRSRWIRNSGFPTKDSVGRPGFCKNASEQSRALLEEPPWDADALEDVQGPSGLRL